jgi:hypothetical protein
VSSLRPVNKKARKVEEMIVAASGDIEALQKKTKAHPARIYYPMGCTLNSHPAGKWITRVARRASASRWNAICSIAIWVADGLPRFRTI